MAATKLQSPPFILFWLGVLTGAIIVGLLFLYKLYAPALEADVFRALTTPVRPTTTTTTTQSMDPLKQMATNPIGADNPEPW